MSVLRGFLDGLIMPGVYFLVLLGVGMVLYWTVHVLLRGFGGRGMTSLVLMFSVVGAVLLGGGNLPWARRSASATFENVHVRFSNPQSSCYGWIFYGSSANRAIISNCVVDAQGATNVRGIYAIDPPPLVVDHSESPPVESDVGTISAVFYRHNPAND